MSSFCDSGTSIWRFEKMCRGFHWKLGKYGATWNWSLLKRGNKKVRYNWDSPTVPVIRSNVFWVFFASMAKAKHTICVMGLVLVLLFSSSPSFLFVLLFFPPVTFDQFSSWSLSCQEWNDFHPERLVQVGDRIISVAENSNHLPPFHQVKTPKKFRDDMGVSKNSGGTPNGWWK